jgi:RHS repeat-associated protein
MNAFSKSKNWRYFPVLLLLMLSASLSQSQYIQRVSGFSCTGRDITFMYIGPTCSSYNNWVIGGGGTIVSSNGSTVVVRWNSVTTNAYVTANHTGCTSATTGVFTIQQSVASSITISASQIDICSGTPVTFTSSIQNGGNSPAYQWKLNGENVSGATGSTFSLSSLTNGQQVSCVLTPSNDVCSTTPTVSSNVITINVDQSQIGVPSAPAGTTSRWQGPGTDVYTTSATNATGYTWTISPSSAGTISNAGVVTWNAGFDGMAVISVKATRCSAESETVSTEVLVRSITAGTIVPSSLTIPSGASPGQLTANPASGGTCSEYSYQWQHSTDGITWNDIAGAGGQNYTPGELTTTTYFRRRASCGADQEYSNVCTIAIGTTSCDVNFVRERVFTQPGITSQTTANSITDPGSVKQSTQYFDGLGRLIQTVNKQASQATGTSVIQDIVTPIVYDAFGRENNKYLPYVANASDGNYRCDPIPEQKSFNALQFSNEQFYYSQTDYEPSPLNRTEKMYMAGNSWVGSSKGITSEYWHNGPADNVRIWQVTNTSGFGDYTTAAIYPAGELYKNIKINEKGNQEIEFKDKQGRSILKKVQLTASADNGTGSGHPGWLCTYYIYDDLDNLRCVVQPRGVELLEQNNWDFTALGGDILNEQCFRYEYDGRKRMTMKKIPGAGEVYMIYDVRDRLVFMQDANFRLNNQWLTTLYDNLNRVVITAIIVWTGTTNDLQQAVTYQTTNGVVTGIQNEFTLYQPNTSGTYQALVGITLDNGFSTATGADFTAEIVSGGPGSLESTIDGMVVSNYPVPNGISLYILTKTGYDTYATIPAPSSLTGDIDNAYTGSNYLNTSYNSFPYAEPVVQNNDTRGLATWSQTRILGTNQFLYAASIYDEKGRLVQTKSLNKTNGTDITTTQYTFNGQPLVTVQKQEKAGSVNLQTHIVVAKMNYSNLGQLLNITKKINSVIDGVAVAKPDVEIASQEYDVLGQLKKKNIGKKKDINGNYTIDPLQSLTYDYNILGWLLGVNRNYLSVEGQTNDGVLFGFELGYDKKINMTGQNFNNSEYNGNIAGMIWKSDGDDIRRKYDYIYDPSSRLLRADFTQHNGDDHLWNNAKVNYTVKMGDGINPLLAYDANGNIQRMQQWGLTVNGSPQIDDLRYTYYNNGNKLRAVTDPLVGAMDYKVGDFTDNYSGADDYGYDRNGNLITDRNKRMGTATGAALTTGGAITYNHLNLPSQMQVKDVNGNDRGTIWYTHDAIGNKLQKIVLEKNVTVTHNGNGHLTDITTTTTYLGGFEYESKSYTNGNLSGLQYTDKLQIISHEEGRTRYIAAGNTTPAHFEHDYFIKDNLGNVRMVLTEQNDTRPYVATMENALRTSENQLFANIDASAIPTPNDYPAGNSVIVPNQYVARVNGTDQKKGPAIVLKVMAGDVVDVGVQSYYRSQTGSPTNNSALSDILTSLAGGIVAASGETKGTLADLSNINSSPLLGALNVFRATNNPDQTTKPKAYLNWILLDEQLNYVSTYPQSNAMAVGTAGQAKTLAYSGIDITKNGYLYIYVSNETENWDVFFDDLSVSHHAGPLLEETHYYPFGLTMARISSKALNITENKKKYNGIEYESSLDVNIGEAFYRTHDPQLGRWWQIDPKLEASQNISPFAAMDNNPVLKSDPMGDIAVVDDAVIGFFKGLFRSRGHFEGGANTRLGSALRSAGRHAANSAKIYGGLFTTDKHRSTLGQVGQFLSRLTWQLPNTIVGFVSSHGTNMIGNVQSVEYGLGATVLRTSGSTWGALTLGSYIISENTIKVEPKDETFQHEYGHYLQSERFGPAYLFGWAIPSVINAWKHPDTHNTYSTEIDASSRAHKYLFQHIPLFWQWRYRVNPVNQDALYEKIIKTMSENPNHDFNPNRKSRGGDPHLHNPDPMQNMSKDDKARNALG